MSTSSDKKIWTWQGSFQDHIRFLIHLPFFFIGSITLPPKAVESIHLSVNSVNRCPFCTGLHCEIGRIAGLENVSVINECAMLSSSERDEYGIFAQYGMAFGKNHGRGPEVEALFQQISSSKGTIAAKSTQGLAFFLLWGSLSGNTLISFYHGTLNGQMRHGSNLVFEVCFAFYYTTLFAIITVVSKILSFVPSNVPSYVSMIIGLVLPSLASIWIVPYGIVGLVLTLTSTLRMDVQYDPLGGDYELIV